MNDQHEVAYAVGWKAWKDRYIICFHLQERREIARQLEKTWEELSDEEQCEFAQDWANGNLASYTHQLEINMGAWRNGDEQRSEAKIPQGRDTVRHD